MTEAEKERAAIVEWLRNSDDAFWIANTHSACLAELADAIQSGDHLKESDDA